LYQIFQYLRIVTKGEKMSRLIKFRGRHAEHPVCWIYGYFVVVEGGCHIVNDAGTWKIRAGTEGQFIGSTTRTRKRFTKET
jgi:hypothetical protein